MARTNGFTRRTLLTAAAGTTLLPLFRAPLLHAAPRAPSLPFVIIGDWGREGAEKQREVGIQMGRSAEAIESRLVISLGDNFYEDGVTGVADPQWVQSFEDIYAAPSLQTRWDVILGNHDYRGDVDAQIDYSSRSARWHMPARAFTRRETLTDGTTAEFFYIDTNPFITAYRHSDVKIDGQDTDTQLKWLDGALGSSTAKWKIVIGHHPIQTVTGGKRNTPELIARLDPLLRKHKVKIYINGHDHNFQYLDHDGINYITNGAGSQVYEPGPAAPGQYAGGHHGFMTAELSANNFAFKFIDDSATELFAANIPA